MNRKGGGCKGLLTAEQLYQAVLALTHISRKTGAISTLYTSHKGQSQYRLVLLEFEAIVDAGPDLENDGVVRWRAVDLKRVIEERFGVCYGERHVMKLLNQLGFSRISTRPQHPKQDEGVIAAFKKLPRHAESPSGRADG